MVKILPSFRSRLGHGLGHSHGLALGLGLTLGLSLFHGLGLGHSRGLGLGHSHHMIVVDTPGDVYIYSGATAGATKNTAGAQSVSTMLSEESRFDLFADFVEIYLNCLSVWFFVYSNYSLIDSDDFGFTNCL